MFRKLLGGKSATPAAPPPPAVPVVPVVPSAEEADATDAIPRVVKFNGDLIAASHAEELRGGDWQAIEAFLAEPTDSEVRDWYVDALARSLPGRPEWIDAWVSARPGAYIPLLFSGCHKVVWAWEARGRSRAQFVERDSWAVFFERLRAGRVDLNAAAEVAPSGEAGAYVFMIAMAMGLQLPKPEIVEIYAQAQQRRPWHQLAHMAMVQALAKKWSGSVELMLDFARSTREAPFGSGAPIAMLSAHFEAELELGEEYWLRPDVEADLVWVADQLALAPDRYRSPMSLIAHNAMLYEFGKMEQAGRARVALGEVRGRLTFPFTYLSDPVAGYKFMLKKYSR